MILNSCNKEVALDFGLVYDIDSNLYRTVRIGDQVWMAENLRVKHYNNGDPIENLMDSEIWFSIDSGAYCIFNFDIHKNEHKYYYGPLYNYYAAVDERKIAPSGWHVPSDEEWRILIEYLGGEEIAGGKLKATSTEHWAGDNTGATNETGFSGLPSGFRLERLDSVNFGYRGYCGYWSTTGNQTHAWMISLSWNTGSINRTKMSKQTGMSIRCIKD